MVFQKKQCLLYTRANILKYALSSIFLSISLFLKMHIGSWFFTLIFLENR